MALIKCPECGKEISDRAEVCIHCAFPGSKDEARGRGERGFSAKGCSL